MKTRLNYKIHKYTSLRRIYYSNNPCLYPQNEIVQNVKPNTISFFELNISEIRQLAYFLLDEQITILNFMSCVIISNRKTIRYCIYALFQSA